MEDGATALLVASYHPCPKIVSNLLEHGASVHARRRDGVTSLIMASNRGHLENVDLLLGDNADVNVSMRDGTTALHTATYKGHTQAAHARSRTGCSHALSKLTLCVLLTTLAYYVCIPYADHTHYIGPTTRR